MNIQCSKLFAWLTFKTFSQNLIPAYVLRKCLASASGDSALFIRLFGKDGNDTASGKRVFGGCKGCKRLIREHLWIIHAKIFSANIPSWLKLFTSNAPTRFVQWFVPQQCNRGLKRAWSWIWLYTVQTSKSVKVERRAWQLTSCVKLSVKVLPG